MLYVSVLSLIKCASSTDWPPWMWIPISEFVYAYFLRHQPSPILPWTGFYFCPSKMANKCISDCSEPFSPLYWTTIWLISFWRYVTRSMSEGWMRAATMVNSLSFIHFFYGWAVMIKVLISFKTLQVLPTNKMVHHLKLKILPPELRSAISALLKF